MRRSATLLVGLLAFLAVPAASASTTEVGVKDFGFDPSTAAVKVGDAVHWSRETGSVASHSVTANDGFFNSGNPTTGAIDLTVTFSAGAFRYYCQVHGSPSGSGTSGMNGFVRVPVSLSAAPSGRPFSVTWATSSSKTGSTYDVQWRIGSAKWKAWNSATKALKGVFGKNGKPTVVHQGTTYSFRARSRGAGGASRWSPPASFTA
jgi:plastocyanin